MLSFVYMRIVYFDFILFFKFTINGWHFPEVWCYYWVIKDLCKCLFFFPCFEDLSAILRKLRLKARGMRLHLQPPCRSLAYKMAQNLDPAACLFLQSVILVLCECNKWAWRMQVISRRCQKEPLDSARSENIWNFSYFFPPFLN